MDARPYARLPLDFQITVNARPHRRRYSIPLAGLGFESYLRPIDHTVPVSEKMRAGAGLGRLEHHAPTIAAM